MFSICFTFTTLHTYTVVVLKTRELLVQQTLLVRRLAHRGLTCSRKIVSTLVQFGQLPLLVSGRAYVPHDVDVAHSETASARHFQSVAT